MCAVYYLYDNTVFFIKSIKTSKENNQQQLIIFNSIEREEYFFCFFFLLTISWLVFFLFKGVSKPFDLPHLSSLFDLFCLLFFFFFAILARAHEKDLNLIPVVDGNGITSSLVDAPRCLGIYW